jgi:hypothetical protein
MWLRKKKRRDDIKRLRLAFPNNWPKYAATAGIRRTATVPMLRETMTVFTNVTFAVESPMTEAPDESAVS